MTITLTTVVLLSLLALAPTIILGFMIYQNGKRTNHTIKKFDDLAFAISSDSSESRLKVAEKLVVTTRMEIDDLIAAKKRTEAAASNLILAKQHTEAIALALAEELERRLDQAGETHAADKRTGIGGEAS